MVLKLLWGIYLYFVLDSMRKSLQKSVKKIALKILKIEKIIND